MFIARILAAALLLSAAGPLRSADEESPERKAAETWLALIDAGQYGESWEHASDTFKKAITKENWEKAVKRVRDQIGPLESRNFTKSQEMKNPPNAPPGEYYGIVYTTDFANKKKATELIVLERESNAWRTSGYFVK